MSKSIQWLRKNKIINSMLDNLYVVKLWKRNMRARPIRRKQTQESYRILETADKNCSHVFFCGVPMHKNMGDQAQRYLIEKWITDNFPEKQIIALPTWPFYDRKFKKRIRTFIKPEDVIIIQSGYCTTDRHYDHPMHKFLVKSFPDTRILIMPQTVRFVVKRHGYATGRIYDCHSKLLFLARDETSFKLAKDYMPNTNILLFPDIVTTLIGNINVPAGSNGILICVRNDDEKKYSNEEINDLQEKFQSEKIPCELSDTNCNLSLDKIIKDFYELLIKEITFFAKHAVVITDRYHGTIFSMIANVPVIVLSTTDHKVKTGTQWFEGIYDKSYYNADSLEEAHDIALSLLKERKKIDNKSFFKEKYYDQLKDVFMEMTN